MFEWMPDLHWFRPWFLLGILLAPPVFFLVRYQRVTKNISWQKHIDPALLQALLIPGQAVASRNSASLPMLASLMWVLACIAMAGPSWQQSERPVYQQAWLWHVFPRENHVEQVVDVRSSPAEDCHFESPEKVLRDAFPWESSILLCWRKNRKVVSQDFNFQSVPFFSSEQSIFGNPYFTRDKK